MTRRLAEVLGRDNGAASVHSNHVAVVVCVNEGETELVPTESAEMASPEALAKAVCSHMSDREPCYIVAHYPNVDAFLVITHIPEEASVRKKVSHSQPESDRERKRE